MNLFSFCNSTALKVSDSTIIKKVFDKIQLLNNINLKKNNFPGSQPVALEKKNIESLKNNKYVVCEKTDGERHLLVLINIDNKPMCFFLNRNNELLFISFTFKKEVFEGSIFDGEIIKNTKGIWNYIIHDCVTYNGLSYITKNHYQRYGAILDLIIKRYINKESDCVNIKTKLFYEYGYLLEKTWEHIKSTTENNIDGLIFTPVFSPIELSRQWDLFKWKNGNNHTIDLLVKKELKKINCYGLNNRNTTNTNQVTTKKDLYIFKSIKESETNFNEILNFCEEHSYNNNTELLQKGVIIEFKYNIEADKLIPFRKRLDKQFPNGKITIDNTIKNIKESLNIEDLF